MYEYKLTRVWEIDHHLVVADTAKDAIDLYKLYLGKDCYDEPTEIIGVSSSEPCRTCLSYHAIIKK